MLRIDGKCSGSIGHHRGKQTPEISEVSSVEQGKTACEPDREIIAESVHRRCLGATLNNEADLGYSETILGPYIWPGSQLYSFGMNRNLL